MLTLFDLIPGFAEKQRKKDQKKKPEPNKTMPAAVRTEPLKRQNGRPGTMQERYDLLVVKMKQKYGIRVRRWRKSMSGVAWEVHYRDGSVSRLIESPYPRGPMSAAIFLHEIGHHAIGFRRYRPRCLEEYHAWKWAVEEMENQGILVTERVKKRMHDSLRYAVAKAMRRGLKRLPQELIPYVPEMK